MKKESTSSKRKTPRGIKLTLIAFLLIIIFMGVVFNFKVPLVYSRSDVIKTNIIAWPIQQVFQLLVYKGFAIDPNNHWGKTLTFFLTEAPYILLILYIFSYLFNFARGFSTEKEISEWLQNKSGFSGRIVGALFGFVSPFCSCSTIPVVTSMAKARIPFGTLIAFLITSPMINESGIALLWSFFGFKVTLIYITFGFLIGIIGSYIASLLKLDDQLKIKPDKINNNVHTLRMQTTFTSLNKKAYKAANENFIKFWWILVIAMSIGALMHGFIPEQWIKHNIGNKWWGPLLLVPIGALMYLNISATVPIISELNKAGVGLGSSLGFMMGINTLSLPEIIILSKLFKRKFMIFFVTYLVVAILIFSYIIMLLPYGATH